MGLVLPLTACGSNRPKPGAPTASTRFPGSTATAPAPPTAAAGQRSNAGGTHIVLPATFTVQAGGALQPSSVSAPAGVPILLTVVSGDGRAHKVVLESEPPRHLTVPAGGRSRVRVTGLANGRDQITVDGSPRGSLIVGARPGP